jgi:hypothetical protein
VASPFSVIRPQDDGNSQQCSDWADNLITNLKAGGHSKAIDVDNLTPANSSNILAALKSGSSLICYFGHGDEGSWLTHSATTVDKSNVSAAAGRAIVSVACKTARGLGPDAITAGVEAWLGFTCKVAVITPHKGVDPIGDAIVDGLTELGAAKTMQEARDEIRSKMDKLVTEYDTGKYAMHPAANIGYFAALALRDHVVVHGNTGFVPLK